MLLLLFGGYSAMKLAGLPNPSSQSLQNNATGNEMVGYRFGDWFSA